MQYLEERYIIYIMFFEIYSDKESGDLMGLVLNTAQREQAGSDSYNRFEYQAHWIVYHIIN